MAMYILSSLGAFPGALGLGDTRPRAPPTQQAAARSHAGKHFSWRRGQACSRRTSQRRRSHSAGPFVIMASLARNASGQAFTRS